jgi:hypothetical protein
MHPFPPAVSLILLAMADGGAMYWRVHGAQPDLSVHRAALFTVIGAATLFGSAVAVWLWTLRLRFPLWVALGTVGFVFWATLFPVHP